MHEFNNNWLKLRESVDKKSRNLKIIELINKKFNSYNSVSIIDLGTGAGSNYNYLKPKLKFYQNWLFTDISINSMNYFKQNLNLSKKIITTKFQIFDVIKDLDKIKFQTFDIVTGSAFLDILPRNWFYRFHKFNSKTEIILFALNYNGNFKFFPKHKYDKNIVNLFNKDQKTDKGIGDKAVGPDCSSLINNTFKRTHHTYLMNSNWDVEKNYQFQKYFLYFCSKVIENNKVDYSSWLNFRYNCIKQRTSRLILQNTDFLAIKKQINN